MLHHASRRCMQAHQHLATHNVHPYVKTIGSLSSLTHTTGRWPALLLPPLDMPKRATAPRASPWPAPPPAGHPLATCQKLLEHLRGGDAHSVVDVLVSTCGRLQAAWLLPIRSVDVHWAGSGNVSTAFSHQQVLIHTASSRILELRTDLFHSFTGCDPSVVNVAHIWGQQATTGRRGDVGCQFRRLAGNPKWVLSPDAIQYTPQDEELILS